MLFRSKVHTSVVKTKFGDELVSQLAINSGIGPSRSQVVNLSSQTGGLSMLPYGDANLQHTIPNDQQIQTTIMPYGYMVFNF